MAVVVADVLDLTAAALHKSGQAALEAFWTPLATQGLAQAQRDVRRALQLRGYTDAQIDAWTDLDATVKQQALFWTLTMGGGLQAADDKFVKALDQREALKTVLLGELTDGLIGHGDIKTVEGETFRDPGSPDPEPRKWRPW